MSCLRKFGKISLASKSIGLSFRFASTRASAVVYGDYGDPKEKLRLISYDLQDPQKDQILVKTLASPINPADINQVEGVYPSKPPLTTELTSEPSAVGGNEGVFEVVSVGSDITSFKPGDWAIPRQTNFGTWRTHALVDPSALTKITRDNITPLQAATISVNPSTAYQMLKSFISLKPGDWFIQNGGNSGVGRAAIQLGRIWGYKSISVVRDRDDIEALRQELTDLGATHVVTEEQISSKAFRETIKSWIKKDTIKLALNCVGGKSGTNIARQLGSGGHFVTYGGMSKQPVIFPTSLFIFKDIKAHGYWLSAWSNKNPEEKSDTVEKILELIRTKQFKDVPVQENTLVLPASDQDKFASFQQALANATKGFGGKKQVIVYK